MNRRFALVRFGCVGLGLTFLAALATVRAETLTIATYNVRNYGPADRMTDAGFRTGYPKPEAEKESLRRVIRAVNADLLVLQEMGPDAYLEELRRDLRAEGCDYPHAALAVAADPDRHVALLSRRPLRKVGTLTDLGFKYLGGEERVKRGVLEAVIATDGGELTLFAVHLKSRLTDRPDDPQSSVRRMAEAVAVRDAILRRFPDPATSRFVLLGDCNDSPDSKTVERLRHRGKTPVVMLLPAMDSRGETWTHYYRKEDVYSRVDHVFVSAGLQPSVLGGGARIYDGDGVIAASDHRPVVVRLDLAKR